MLFDHSVAVPIHTSLTLYSHHAYSAVSPEAAPPAHSKPPSPSCAPAVDVNQAPPPCTHVRCLPWTPRHSRTPPHPPHPQAPASSPRPAPPSPVPHPQALRASGGAHIGGEPVHRVPQPLPCVRAHRHHSDRAGVALASPQVEVLLHLLRRGCVFKVLWGGGGVGVLG